VLHAHDGRRPVLLAVDPVARSRGIRPGMSLAHAQSLAPDLHAEAATPDRDDRALARLAGWCLFLSPIVAVDPPPDGVWIDTTGCNHLHGGEAAMLEHLSGRFGAQGYVTRLGLAGTPGAAHAIALYGRDPLTVVAPSDERAAIAPLPIPALRLESETVAGLYRRGLRRIAQLLAAPRGPLVRRFGAESMTPLDQALGAVHEPIQPLRPIERVRADRGMVEPIGTAEAIAVVLGALVDEICATLAARGLGARLVDLQCRRVDDTIQALRIGMTAPVNDGPHIRRLLTKCIPSIEPGFKIEAMTLLVTRDEAMASARQIAAWPADGRIDVAGGDIACVLDRLRNRVGPHRVRTLRPVPAHWPEKAQAPMPIGDDAPRASGNDALDLPSGLSRPVRLVSPPAPVDVTSLLPDGAPRQFVWQGTHCRIRAADGPERLHDDWWEPDAAMGAVRDDWIAEDEAGERFWPFRRGDGVHDGSGDRAWFLHGLF